MKLEDYINNRGISIKNGTIWVILFFLLKEEKFGTMSHYELLLHKNLNEIC